MKALKFFFAFVFLFENTSALAAACCASGFGAPSFILSDDERLLGVSYVLARQTTDVSSEGIWTDRSDPKTLNTLDLNYAERIFKNAQLGIDLPIISENNFSNRTVLGDTKVGFGYDLVKESEVNPKLLAFSRVTLPTGKSMYERNTPLGEQATGRGVYQLSAGVYAKKNWIRWDVSGYFEGHRGFHRRIHDLASGETVDLNPGWGSSEGVDGGYNFEKWRFGAGILNFTEDPISAERSGAVSSGATERVTEFNVSALYLYEPDFAVRVAYANQKWFGNPTGTTLGESIALSVQKRWF